MILGQIFGICVVRVKSWFRHVRQPDFVIVVVTVQTIIVIYLTDSPCYVIGIVDMGDKLFVLSFMKFG